jgi:hypothetical protein
MTFAAPWLLLGLLAAGIPPLLHLISSVRAKEMPFPTLRFLRRSMEKTARRRRLQHWLLMLLRSVLLALLAMAVAEPISRATGGWLGSSPTATALVIDNSYSMAARAGDSTRLSRAKTLAASLLGGEQRPALSAVLTSARPDPDATLTGDLAAVRERASRVEVSYGRSALARRVARALDLLADEASAAQKSLYVFTDARENALRDVIELDALSRSNGVHLFLIDTSDGPSDNAGISRLEITGQRVVDSTIEFAATVVNASPREASVDLRFHAAQGPAGHGAPLPARTIQLRPAGTEGDRRTVRFYRSFAQPGLATGEAVIVSDDALPDDNIRRFSLRIGPRVRALVVRGQGGEGFDPAHTVIPALTPYRQKSTPWPVETRTVDWSVLSGADLAGVDAAFFCQVPAFTDQQARAIAEFTARGGTSVFFPGPACQVDNYNRLLVEGPDVEGLGTTGGLIDRPLDVAVGQVGPRAPGRRVARVDVEHPYFNRLYESHADYLQGVVQRYWTLEGPIDLGRRLVDLAGGDPLVIAKPFGQGRAVTCLTTASLEWSSFPLSPIFLPMVFRSAIQARSDAGADRTYLAGDPVPIPTDALPPAGDAKPVVTVLLPEGPRGEGGFVTLPVEGPLVRFDATDRPGFYDWRVEGASASEPAPAGRFAVNPHSPETLDAHMDLLQAVAALRRRGVKAYAGRSLEDVHDQALAEARGRNWWDVLVAAAVLVLVTESVLANRAAGPLNPRATH